MSFLNHGPNGSAHTSRGQQIALYNLFSQSGWSSALQWWKTLHRQLATSGIQPMTKFLLINCLTRFNGTFLLPGCFTSDSSRVFTSPTTGSTYLQQRPGCPAPSLVYHFLSLNIYTSFQSFQLFPLRTDAKWTNLSKFFNLADGWSFIKDLKIIMYILSPINQTLMDAENVFVFIIILMRNPMLSDKKVHQYFLNLL